MSNRSEREARSGFLLRRWGVLGAVALVVAVSPIAWPWSAACAVALTGAALAGHLPPVARWQRHGWWILADTAVVGACIAAGVGLGSPLFIGLFSIVLCATVVGDRIKTLVATGALLGILAALASVGILPGFNFAAGTLLLGLAGLHFGILAERTVRASHSALPDHDEAAQVWALLDITETVGSTLELVQVMRSIVQRVGDLVQTDSCSILLAEDKLRRCKVVASKGHPDVDMLEVDLADYPEIRRALETREPVVIEDVETDPRVATVRQILLDKGYRSLLVLPLIFGGRPQ